MPWHRYERALCRIARAYRFTLEESYETGDRLARNAIVTKEDGDDVTIEDLNLTELAKDLAKELET